MAKVHEQHAVTEASDESVTAKAHGQPKAAKLTKEHGKTDSHGQTIVASESHRGGRWMGAGVVVGMTLAVALRTGMHWWSGRFQKPTPVSGYFNKMRTLAARLWS